MPAVLHRGPVRLLIVPGLRDSGPAHWQTWLQSLHRGALRVEQTDWDCPDLPAWATRIEATLSAAGPGPWIVAAHSFGCLALARYLADARASPVVNALMVAPADPDKFGLADALPWHPLGIPSSMWASDSDPWMSPSASRTWARRWGSRWLSLGDAGHVNAEAGFGPLPRAQRWVLSAQQQASRREDCRPARQVRWQFAV